jgi:two-component system, OmpR family, response regulator MprA
MGKRVLIVEDDPAITEVLADLLGAEGYAFRTAADGAAGLAAVAEYAPDLVLVDVMMPVLGGPEMLRHLRASGGPQPVAVLMSAARRPDLDGLEVAAFVAKPFDVEQLVATVERLIGPAREAC